MKTPTADDYEQLPKMAVVKQVVEGDISEQVPANLPAIDPTSTKQLHNG